MTLTSSAPSTDHAHCGSLTADLAGLTEVSRQVHNVGASLRNRREPVDAVLSCPAVPEVSEFLHALSSARQRHSAELGTLASFFADATSSLTQFSRELDGHERSTAASWGRWAP